jgi:hypothetical protein
MGNGVIRFASSECALKILRICSGAEKVEIMNSWYSASSEIVLTR